MARIQTLFAWSCLAVAPTQRKATQLSGIDKPGQGPDVLDSQAGRTWTRFEGMFRDATGKGRPARRHFP